MCSHCVQTLLKDLKVPLQLKWSRSNDLPHLLGSYPQAVVVKGKVYVGGAEPSRTGQKGLVMLFNPPVEQWTTLPLYDYAHFGMAVVNNQLILVGGVNPQTEQKTNKIGVWNEQYGKWVHPYPSMQVVRQSPRVVNHDDKWLVVVGDFGDRMNDVSRVEILDISTFEGKWIAAPPITQPLYKVTSAVVGNLFVLCGGIMRRGAAIQVCLDDLISQATAAETAAVNGVNALPTPSPWQTLPRAPLEGSTALAYDGALLVVGGVGTNVIHFYQPINRMWIKLTAELPTERAACVCVVLPDGRLLVTGGDINEKRVDIACF